MWEKKYKEEKHILWESAFPFIGNTWQVARQLVEATGVSKRDTELGRVGLCALRV